jgi:RNA polymerase sigma factor (sigma-70 family)
MTSEKSYLLSSPEGCALALKAKAGCEESMDTLVRLCEPLVGSVVRRFRSRIGRALDGDDLAQCAWIGFVQAVRGFTPGDARFITYACASMIHEVRKRSRAATRIFIYKPKNLRLKRNPRWTLGEIPYSQQINLDETDCIEAVLGKCGATQYEAEMIKRVFLGGETDAEIAKSRGVARQTVSAAKKNCLTKIRRQLEGNKERKVG